MSRTTFGGFRRGRRVADSMTPEFHACVDHWLAAERAGDLEAALEWHLGVPMFRRGRHRMILQGLIALGDPLPPWVWARLLAYLAFRCEDGVTGRRAKDAQRLVGETLHGPLMAECYRRRGDPVQVVARVLGESWAFHQYAAHEAGVLVSFIEEFASGPLLENAGLARRWADARLSGYELGQRLANGRLLVREASAGDWVETLDLGARSCTTTGWVLGRLVPTGDGPLMFDRHPLGVPEQVAVDVAGAAGAWLPVVASALRAGLLTQDDLLREDYELTCDVPELELLRYATPAPDLARVTMQLREGRDEIGRAAFRVLERAGRGDISVDDAPYVAAALLNVHAFDAVKADVRRAATATAWSTWAPLLPPPACHRAEDLALPGSSAA